MPKLTMCTCGQAFEGRRCPCKGPDPRKSHAHRKATAELLRDDPPCFWCGAPATSGDHLDPLAAGGDPQGPMVPACGPCNASRGAQLQHGRVGGTSDSVRSDRSLEVRLSGTHTSNSTPAKRASRARDRLV